MLLNIKDYTLEEKLKLLTGKTCWQTEDLDGKIPALFVADGPNGLRKVAQNDKGEEYTVKATAMPNLSVLANSWDEKLAYLDGSTIADDCLENDVDILLAPGVNIKRNVLNGRNFEYFSEDPFLAGKLARAYIEGVQDKGVGTSLKHFACNNSEHDRFSTSVEVEDRALQEIYLPAFEEAIKAKPWTVMCSYNPVNGIYSAQHKKLLKTILRDQLKFEGLTISDWEAVRDHPQSVKATLGVRMPYDKDAFNTLKDAYEKGVITEEEIDYCAGLVIDAVNKKINANRKPPQYTKEERHLNAVEIAKESIVLLKNEQNILPIKPCNKISVLGMFDSAPVLGGGGSASVQTDYKIQPLSTLLKDKLNVEVYANRVIHGVDLHGLTYLKKHLENVYESELVILCVGEQAPIVGESVDRASMKLSAVQEQMILSVCEYNKNVIVLVYGGSAIDMSAWIDKVKGVVFVGFAGEGVNEALSSILLGETAPSGKLSETFPMCVEDTVTEGKFDNGQVDYYKEGIFVGYRHYDSKNLSVLFPFGHGLSYADFEYSNLTIEKTGETDFIVSYDIKNVSGVDAKEISQVYVKDVFASVVRPKRELKGFSKDLIKAGQIKRVSVNLDFRSFAYYSIALDGWTIEPGKFVIEVGASSRDIRLSGEIKL